MSKTTEVTETDLHDLLKIFERKPFEAGSCEEGTLEGQITQRCEQLFKQDYTLIELDNSNGILCPRYPGRIFIPEHAHCHMPFTITANNTSIFNQSIALNTTSSHNVLSTTPSTSNGKNSHVTSANSKMQKHHPDSLNNHQQLLQQTSSANVVPPTNAMTNTTTSTIYEDLYDLNKIRELITMAKYARCRQRFVVPVIMYRGKYICRSATISVNAETYGRKVVDYAYDYINGTNYSDPGNQIVDDENNDNNEDSLMNHALNEPSPFSYEEVIRSDIQLLNALNVSTIVDLMVEKRKVKYFMTVSSSEKADPENHYGNFNLLAMPYPGCEFFKQFRDNNYLAKNIYYDWKQSFNDAKISIPHFGPTTELNINWDEYQNWDLVLITQNYLKACLKYIQEDNSGLLIHCISGWDRTPLFVSLVRLSLWADGLIHKSLNAMQMTYFTLAYDWYLFGHQLPDRLKRGEDILFFCFHMLKFIGDEEFKIVEYRKRTKISSSSGGSSNNVPKSDCFDDEPLKEDFSLCCDQDSNDSISNSSNCDMSTTDNSNAISTTHGSCNNLLTNRSPNAKRSKTSPISVPGVSAARQRNESTSSVGSWQVVTVTGSLESMTSESNIRMQQDENDGNCTNATNSSLPEKTPPITKRKQRLNTIRSIFVQAYGKTVGLKFKEGSGMNLGTFVGNIADQIF